MTNQHKYITGVLVLAVIVLAWLWIGARNNLDNVLGRLEEDTKDSRAEIVEKCNPLAINDPGKKAECEEALSNLQKVIADYKVEVKDADQSY